MLCRYFRVIQNKLKNTHLIGCWPTDAVHAWNSTLVMPGCGILYYTVQYARGILFQYSNYYYIYSYMPITKECCMLLISVGY